MKLVIRLTAAALLALATQHAASQSTDSNAASKPSDTASIDQQFIGMQEKMRLMQSLMEKIAATQDPKERQRLLAEHWTAMQAMMTTMHGAMAADARGAGGHMKGGPMMGGHMMWQDYRNLSPEQLRERQYMMDRWMPMHQMMMEQMMQHQHWMMGPPASAPPKK